MTSQNQKILALIDQLEGIVENGKGFLGMRTVNEEEFFTQVQRIRASLKDNTIGVTNKTVADLIAETSAFTRHEQLQVIAALAASLANENSNA